MDAIVIVVGLVLGAGIFRAPQLVAANAGGTEAFLLLWLAGGIVSLAGALCYAELATAYSHPGGEYHFLSRAFGPRAGFLCAWSRMAVIQTGSIAILAFVAGDFAVPILNAGRESPVGSAVVAAVVVVVLTGVNALGIREGRGTQYVLTAAEVLGLIAVIAAGLLGAPAASAAAPAVAAPAAAVPAEATSASFGLAMVFVLLTFGGWSEAAYLSAEVRDRRRGIRRTLTWGIAIITLLYLLANLAYLRALGLEGIAASSAVAADVMRAAAGPVGAAVVSAVVIASALSSANATIITGARSNYALGRDVTAFRLLGAWREQTGTPANAVLVQGIISLALVGLGAMARGGFETMVAYTAPVFWLILLGTGIALFVLRAREPSRERPFRVPLYPITPVVFCASATYMLYSSVAYAGRGALLGVVVMLAGLPVLAFFGRQPEGGAEAAPSSLTRTPDEA